jgi:AcrR family transcriptional regulator
MPYTIEELSGDDMETKTKKEDPRVLRTRLRLREAMLSLLEEQEYSNITISDLTQTARLNRATFYLHYEGKEALLIDALDWHFGQLTEEIDKKLEGKSILDNALSERMTFAYVAEHRKLYEVLLSPTGPGFAMQRMIDAIASFGEARVSAMLPEGTDIPEGFVLTSQHVAGGLFALVRWWVQKGMPYSVEEMAELAHAICTNGTLTSLEWEPGQD